MPENIACTNEKNIAYNSDKNIACSVSKEELKLDNTDVYVPDGWQRQLFKLSGSNYGIGQHKVCYTSPYGRQVWGKKTNGRIS